MRNDHANDPLLAAIYRYIFDGAEFDRLPDNLSEEQEEEAFDRLCGQPDAALVAWSTPARSRESAVAALRLALQILEENDGEPIVISLVTAALAYFGRIPAT
ncbi:hypothetical protein FJ938_13175 [Mesorhizobium sp. B2-4-14]|uniref:hypothetical protein n=1 Tax=Mesorhizobium sp. B2-4-14 TaxID=2589935 RepID=UPI00112865BF|nr:hypothetical protein [Mesorhizobium sp. B2-4-14]TPL06425.1 hypothetical protein FJ938_13175 [Mesorhizobium sp. B2-4-14]